MRFARLNAIKRKLSFSFHPLKMAYLPFYSKKFHNLLLGQIFKYFRRLTFFSQPVEFNCMSQFDSVEPHTIENKKDKNKFNQY